MRKFSVTSADHAHEELQFATWSQTTVLTPARVMHLMPKSTVEMRPKIVMSETNGAVHSRIKWYLTLITPSDDLGLLQVPYLKRSSARRYLTFIQWRSGGQLREMRFACYRQIAWMCSMRSYSDTPKFDPSYTKQENFVALTSGALSTTCDETEREELKEYITAK